MAKKIRNKIIIGAVILFSVFIGYLSGLVTVFNPGDIFVERKSTVKIIDAKTRLYYVLPSDAYLLRIKHINDKGRDKKLVLNGAILEEYIGKRSKRSLLTEYIHIPRDMIRSKENTLDINISGPRPESMELIISNYRRNLNNDVYVLFKDSSYGPAKSGIAFLLIFFAFFLPISFFAFSFIMCAIIGISRKKALIYQGYSVIPLVAFLIGINLFNAISSSFGIVFSFRYLLLVGIIPFFVINFVIMIRNLLDAKKNKDISLSFFLSLIKHFLVIIKKGLEAKDYGNILIIISLGFLLLCPLFIILGSEPTAEKIAEASYILLSLGLILKLFLHRGRKKL